MYHKAGRLHVAMHLVSNRSQKMPKCGKNISETPLMADVHFLTHFDVICDLLRTEKTQAPLPAASKLCCWAS